MLVSVPTPSPPEPAVEHPASHRFDSSLDLVREQMRSYARLYERTRQRMSPSNERTQRLATASYPMLEEFTNSPSPGERLGAVAILQLFSSERYISFLVKLVGSEKPFVGYHAAKALHFAVGSSDPHNYPKLLQAIRDAQALVASASVGFDTDRQTLLKAAEQELQATIDSLSVSARTYD